MTEQVNTLATIHSAADAIRELDIPSKETAKALVQSAMRMVALDLSNGNLAGAKHTVDKLEAVEKFLKRKVQQQQADRITQNIVAAGRYRTIREIGAWLIDNVDHNGNSRSSHASERIVYKVSEVLTELGIGKTTYIKWMDIGRLPDQEFNEWLAPYLDETIQQNMELYITSLYKYASPSNVTRSYRQDVEPPITLAPYMRYVYVATVYLRDKIQAMQTEIDKGDTPVTQVRFIHEQFRELVADIQKFMTQSGELY